MKVAGFKCFCGKPAFYLKERIRNIKELERSKMFWRYGEAVYDLELAVCQHCKTLIDFRVMGLGGQKYYDFETGEDWNIHQLKTKFRKVKWLLKGYKTYAVGITGIILAINKLGRWPEYVCYVLIFYCLLEMTKRATLPKKGQIKDRE